MTHEDVPTSITLARANFVPIFDKPKYNDLLRMSECFTPILLGIPYKTLNGYHNLRGILSFDGTYKSQHHKVFAPPTRPVIYPIISDDATSVVLSLSDTVHKLLWEILNLH